MWNTQLGSDGVGGQSNPALKNFLRLFSVLAIPATSSLPIVRAPLVPWIDVV
jgi:hypothetical protein